MSTAATNSQPTHSFSAAAEPATRSVIRLARYDAHRVLDLAQELIHLETAARVPADPALDWLAPAMSAGRFELITASIRARLVGFVAGSVVDDHVDIARLVVAAPALATHPEVPAVMLTALIDDSELPWADVVVPRDFTGLGVLLQMGWQLRGGGEEPRRLHLSAARLDRS